jgi:hypothetical protein
MKKFVICLAILACTGLTFAANFNSLMFGGNPNVVPPAWIDAECPFDYSPTANTLYVKDTYGIPLCVSYTYDSISSAQNIQLSTKVQYHTLGEYGLVARGTLSASPAVTKAYYCAFNATSRYFNIVKIVSLPSGAPPVHNVDFFNLKVADTGLGAVTANSVYKIVFDVKNSGSYVVLAGRLYDADGNMLYSMSVVDNGSCVSGGTTYDTGAPLTGVLYGTYAGGLLNGLPSIEATYSEMTILPQAVPGVSTLGCFAPIWDYSSGMSFGLHNTFVSTGPDNVYVEDTSTEGLPYAAYRVVNLGYLGTAATNQRVSADITAGRLAEYGVCARGTLSTSVASCYYAAFTSTSGFNIVKIVNGINPAAPELINLFTTGDMGDFEVAQYQTVKIVLDVYDVVGASTRTILTASIYDSEGNLGFTKTVVDNGTPLTGALYGTFSFDTDLTPGIQVEYKNIAAGYVAADVNQNDIVDSYDIDACYDAAGDVETLIYTLLQSEYGDADLNGTTDAGDYDYWFFGLENAIQPDMSRWNVGDFDGSGTVDAGDYDYWFFGLEN